jgi:uncharacterized membrane protein YadS
VVYTDIGQRRKFARDCVCEQLQVHRIFGVGAGDRAAAAQLQAVDYATIVKLFRVSMLAVVVVVVVSAMFKTEREQAEREIATNGGLAATKKQALVPWFLWVFVILVAINSLGLLPAEVNKGLSDFSRLCLVVAIAALGIKTSFQQLAEAGWRPFTLLLIETLWMAGFVLIAIFARQHGHL